MSKADSNYFPHIDTLKLSKLKTKHKLFILSGYINGQKVAIPDANNNGDFSDDILIYLNILDKPIIENGVDNIVGNEFDVAFEDFDGKRIAIRHINFEIAGSNQQHSYGKNINDEDRFTLYLKSNEHRVANVEIDAQCYQFKISPTMGVLTQFDDYALVFTPCNRKFKPRYGLNECKNPNTIVSIGGSNYKINVSKFGDIMVLTEILDTSPKKIIDFQGISMSNKKIRLADYKGQYVLIDFWGTWCKPCIELMPQIKAASVKYASKLTVISVAFDSDIAKVQSFLSKNNYDWDNIFENSLLPNKDMMTIKFKVTSFPKMLIFSPSGDIIFEENSNSSVKNIEAILSKIIK